MMSHSIECTATDDRGDPVKITFHYNPDFSGDVTIVRDHKGPGIVQDRFNVPGHALLHLVAHGYVLPRKQEALEECTIEELLG